MPPNFTGRVDERKMLADWLNNDNENRLFILRALGGFGKSALSWHWLTHDVDSKQWTKVLWWSFYEGDASFEHFIEETLKYLKLEVPQGQRPQVDELLKAMQSQKILLVMDGFERALSAYSIMNVAYQGDEEPRLEDNLFDCINADAEFFLRSVCALPNIKSKVLMTTCLTPRVVKPRGEFLQGCREVELIALLKEDVVEFFHRQGIKGTYAQIAYACEPYGYHPLSLRLLAGRILKNFRTPGDISVAQELKIIGDIKQQKHHILEVSYNSLPPHEQKLLGTIGCFLSSVEYKILELIAENKGSLDSELDDLREHGLLQFDEKNRRFDLHPIVRHYAYERLTIPDRTTTHTRLRDYFAAVETPTNPRTIDELAPVIELHHHMVRGGQFDEACDLYHDRLFIAVNLQFGAYQTAIELLRLLFPDGEDNLPRLKKDTDQAWVLDALAHSYSLSGQPRRAVQLFERKKEIQEKLGHKKDLAVGLGNVADDQLKIGAFREAERNLRRCIELCHEIEYEFNKAIGHRDLGRVLLYRGDWNDSEQELEKAEKLFGREEQIRSLSVTWAYRALRFLLMARANPKS